MAMIRRSGIGVALMCVLASGTASAQQPSLVLDPASGPAGTMLNASGSGFAKSPCGVSLRFDGAEGREIGSAAVEAGAFSTTVSIPSDATAGRHTVVAVGLETSGEFCGGPSGDEASAVFEAGRSAGFDYRIYLKTRIIGPECTIDASLVDEIRSSTRPRTHAIVQLESLPHATAEAPGIAGTGNDVAILEGLGVSLLDYLNGKTAPGTAYLASIDKDAQFDSPALDDLVRCLVRLEAGDKIAPGLLPAGEGGQNGAPIEVLIQFFHDVDEAEARRVLAEHGVAALPYASPAVWQATAAADVIRALADDDAVQWIQSGPLPFLPTVDDVRAASNVDVVQGLNTTTGAFTGLSGTGVQIAIMDSGVDQHHNDFAGRIVRVAHPGVDHGTHVAGIAAGSGAQSNQNDDASSPNGGTAFQWRGMAPQAGIAAFGSAGGSTAIFSDAINNFSVDVSNHSYVLQMQGQYDAGVMTVDEIVAGVSAGIPARPAVWAAANNGSPSPRDCTGDGVPDGTFPQYPGGCPAAFQTGYFSVLSPCKNCIVVANLLKNSLLHRSTSSLGPTMDGRLKPDVAAIGTGVISVGADTNNMGVATTGNNYRSKSGTSMAAPAVTGMIALMLEQYAQTFSVNIDTAPPLPSTLKALLIQTAVDLADTDPTINFDSGAAVAYGAGPDWAVGYGLVDVQAAVQLIQQHGFVEDSVSPSDVTDEYSLGVAPGQTEVRVTLAWDDLAGSVTPDESAAKLVNDLDLTLIDPNGVVHNPLVLPLLTPNDCDGNPANGVQVGTCPGQDSATQNYFGPAAEGVDRRNNVEQAVVQNGAGVVPGLWKARVSVLNPDGVTIRLPMSTTQSYSLTARFDQPVCNAKGPYTEECAGPMTSVALDGSGSFDPNGAVLTYSWAGSFAGSPVSGVMPSVSYSSLGTTNVNLTVSDGTLTDMCTTAVTIEDTTPPKIPENITIECTSPEGSTEPIGEPMDICDPDPFFSNDAPAIFPFGPTPVMWTATDHSGKNATGTQIVTVEDTVAPTLNLSASPDILWPPNHRLVTVHIGVDVFDLCDNSPDVRLIGIASSEDDSGLTPHDRPNDIQGAQFGTDDRVFRLRAEHGPGTRRDYVVTYRATDAHGKFTDSSVTVRVPKSGAELISRDGELANGGSMAVSTSADGAFVAFPSDATNLVPNDWNSSRDVFVRDRANDTTERVSIGSGGEQANGPSHARGGAPAISGDGNIVAFYSAASNLVGGDGNRVADVFVRDRAAASTERISVAFGGGETDGMSLYPSISEDGTLVAFQSSATNLVTNDANGVADIFVFDRTTQITERVCDGIEGNGPSLTPSISSDGRFLAFASDADNLVPGDTNHHRDVFVCDRTSGAIDRVSIDTAGNQGNGESSIFPSISRDGAAVAFKSLANNLVPTDFNGEADIFVRDRFAGTTERISVSRWGGDANDGSFPPVISQNGRFVAFGSFANNLVGLDTNMDSSLFVRDRERDETLLVDVNDDGEQGDRGTFDVPPALTATGDEIGFVSLATNLAGRDNQQADVFVTCNPFLPLDPPPTLISSPAVDQRSALTSRRGRLNRSRHGGGRSVKRRKVIEQRKGF